MELINNNTFQSLRGTKGNSLTSPLTKKLNDLGVNDGLLIRTSELTTSRPQYYNLEKTTGKKFTCKKVKNGEYFAILRIK